MSDLLIFFSQKEVTEEQQVQLQILSELQSKHSGTRDDLFIKFQMKMSELTERKKQIDEEFILTMQQELQQLKRENIQLSEKRARVLDELRQMEVKSVQLQHLIDTSLKPLSIKLAAYMKHWNEMTKMFNESNLELKNNSDEKDALFTMIDFDLISLDEFNEKMAQILRRLSLNDFSSLLRRYFEKGYQNTQLNSIEIDQRELQRMLNGIIRDAIQSNSCLSEDNLELVFQRIQDTVDSIHLLYSKQNSLLDLLNENYNNWKDFSFNNHDSFTIQNNLNSEFTNSMINSIESLGKKLKEEDFVLPFEIGSEPFLRKDLEAFTKSIQLLTSIYRESPSISDSSLIINQLEREKTQTNTLLLPLEQHFNTKLEEVKIELEIATETTSQLNRLVNDMKTFESFTLQK